MVVIPGQLVHQKGYGVPPRLQLNAIFVNDQDILLKDIFRLEYDVIGSIADRGEVRVEHIEKGIVVGIDGVELVDREILDHFLWGKLRRIVEINLADFSFPSVPLLENEKNKFYKGRKP